jgi:hypothetical protein
MENTHVGMQKENHKFLTILWFGSTFSFSNVHRVVADNSNYYKNIIMDAMRMNHGHVSQCPIVNEEPNCFP